MPLNKEQLEELQTFDTPPQSLRLQGGEVHLRTACRFVDILSVMAHSITMFTVEPVSRSRVGLMRRSMHGDAETVRLPHGECYEEKS